MVTTLFVVALLVGALLAVPYAAYCRRTRRPEILFAVGLAVAALIYVAFAVFRSGGPRAIAVESVGLVAFSALAIVGARWLPHLLAAGWAAHVGWDLAFHSVGSSDYAPWWYPVLCVGFDLVVAGFIAATFWGSGRRRRGRVAVPRDRAENVRSRSSSGVPEQMDVEVQHQAEAEEESVPAKRRRLLGCLLLIGVVLVGGFALLPHPLTVVRLALAPQPRSLPVPVEGVPPTALVDSWDAPRSGGRRHRGIDIFARRGTPVRSPVSGVVLAVGRNRLGGNIVKVLGPGPQVHYFAHLDRFGPIAPRGLIQRGDVIGYVGDTGNARGTPPHLHYGIYVLPGVAINPFPILTHRS